MGFVWLPLPHPERYRWLVLAEEPRLVALPEGHRLAAGPVVDFADLLDEPFLALPESAPGRSATTGWRPTSAAAVRR